MPAQNVGCAPKEKKKGRSCGIKLLSSGVFGTIRGEKRKKNGDFAC